jgi:hypothetical protein
MWNKNPTRFYCKEETKIEHMNELHGVGISDTYLLSNFHAYFHATSLLSHVDKKRAIVHTLSLKHYTLLF